MPTQNSSHPEDVKIVQLIIFHVGNEEFGVPIGEVREIIKAGAVTPIPDAPNFIGGLINVRGDIVATIDLRARFSMSTADSTELKHTIIMRQGENLFGLMVNEVTEVLRVPETEIKNTPEGLVELNDDYVCGVLPINNRLIILLNLARVLSEHNLPDLPREPAAPSNYWKTESAKKEPVDSNGQTDSLIVN